MPIYVRTVMPTVQLHILGAVDKTVIKEQSSYV